MLSIDWLLKIFPFILYFQSFLYSLGLQVECRLEHYASYYFWSPWGSAYPLSTPTWLLRRKSDKASPFCSLLP